MTWCARRSAQCSIRGSNDGATLRSSTLWNGCLRSSADCCRRRLPSTRTWPCLRLRPMLLSRTFFAQLEMRQCASLPRRRAAITNAPLNSSRRPGSRSASRSLSLWLQSSTGRASSRPPDVRCTSSSPRRAKGMTRSLSRERHSACMPLVTPSIANRC